MVSCYQCKLNAVSSCAVGNDACRAKHPKAPGEQAALLPFHALHGGILQGEKMPRT